MGKSQKLSCLQMDLSKYKEMTATHDGRSSILDLQDTCDPQLG